MSQCYECVFFFIFSHSCLSPTKNAAYNRPLDTRVPANAEAPACCFFKDIDEVME